MRKYFKVVLKKIKNYHGEIVEHRPPFGLLRYAKRVRKDGDEQVWIVEDSESKITDLLKNSMCKPNIEKTQENKWKDIRTGKVYEIKEAIEKELGKEVADENRGKVIEIDENEAKIGVSDITKFYAPKSANQILLDEIKAEGKTDVKVIALLEELI